MIYSANQCCFAFSSLIWATYEHRRDVKREKRCCCCCCSRAWDTVANLEINIQLSNTSPVKSLRQHWPKSSVLFLCFFISYSISSRRVRRRRSAKSCHSIGRHDHHHAFQFFATDRQCSWLFGSFLSIKHDEKRHRGTITWSFFFFFFFLCPHDAIIINNIAKLFFLFLSD